MIARTMECISGRVLEIHSVNNHCYIAVSTGALGVELVTYDASFNRLGRAKLQDVEDICSCRDGGYWVLRRNHCTNVNWAGEVECQIELKMTPGLEPYKLSVVDDTLFIATCTETHASQNVVVMAVAMDGSTRWRTELSTPMLGAQRRSPRWWHPRNILQVSNLLLMQYVDMSGGVGVVYGVTVERGESVFVTDGEPQGAVAVVRDDGFLIGISGYGFKKTFFHSLDGQIVQRWPLAARQFLVTERLWAIEAEVDNSPYSFQLQQLNCDGSSSPGVMFRRRYSGAVALQNGAALVLHDDMMSHLDGAELSIRDTVKITACYRSVSRYIEKEDCIVLACQVRQPNHLATVSHLIEVKL